MASLRWTACALLALKRNRSDNCSVWWTTLVKKNAMHCQDRPRLVSIGGCLGVVLAGLLTQSATAKPDEASTLVCFDPHFYREQATRFRQLAAADFTNQMMGLAAAYDAKAARIEVSTDDPCMPFWR